MIHVVKIRLTLQLAKLRLLALLERGHSCSLYILCLKHSPVKGGHVLKTSIKGEFVNSYIHMLYTHIYIHE